MESSWTRDQICVPCIGKWILIQCTTREVPVCLFIFGCAESSLLLGLSLVVSEGCSLVAAHGLLALASLAAERRL